MRILHLAWSYASDLFPAEGAFFGNMIEPLCSGQVDVTVAAPRPYVPRAFASLHPRLRRPTNTAAFTCSFRGTYGCRTASAKACSPERV